MGDILRFHPRVVSDLSQALDWYEHRSAGLGNRFSAAFDHRLDAIERFASIFPFAFADLNLRFARLSKFPYLVIFRAKDERIDIIGLFHSASDPTKWQARASEPM